MQHASLYGRVSSEEQADRGTIQNQIDFGNKYCDLHEISIDRWYKDDGVTGTIPLELRPEGSKLLEDAKAGKIELLLIYKLDRLGRSARVILNSVYELEQYGVKIRSMTEPFDTSDASGRFLLNILAAVADLERETILERFNQGANRAARQGKWLGGIVPYGYSVNEESFLEVNENKLPGSPYSEADIIRLIYHLIAEEGQSTIRVADYINALGVPPSYVKDGRQVKRGKRKENTAGIWRPSRIRNMIVSTTYKGLHLYGKRSNKQREVIPREVPAIVSEEVWDRAQQVLKDNQIEAFRNSKHDYLLRGLIKCGICGLNYHGTMWNLGKKKTGYYTCNGKQKYKGPVIDKCQSKPVPQKWVEDIVWNGCVEYIANPEQAIEKLSEGFNRRKSEKVSYVNEKTKIQQAIKDKDTEKQSILDLYRRKLINSYDLEQQLNKIAKEAAELENRMADLSKFISDDNTQDYNSIEDMLNELRIKLGDGNPPFEFKREIVKRLVQEIIVHTQVNEEGRPYVKVSVKYLFT